LIFAQGNPYRGGLPDRIDVTPDDVESHISPVNLAAVGRRAKWSVLVYMAADNNLAESMFDDVMRIKAAGSDDDVHVCVFFGGPLLSDAFLARLNAGTNLVDDLIFRYLRTPYTKPEFMAHIVRDTARAFPAEKRLLVLSGHGFGWQGGLTEDNEWRKIVDAGKTNLLPGAFERLRIVNVESTLRTGLKMNERLAPGEPPAPGKLDLLAFDLCGMGNLETMLNMADVARIVVASEDAEVAGCYPYEQVIGFLRSAPDSPPRDVAEFLVRGLHPKVPASATSPTQVFPGIPAVTQIALDASRFEDFCRLLWELAVRLTEYVDSSGAAGFARCVQNTWQEAGDYKDIKGLCLNLMDDNPSNEITAAARTLVEFFDRSGFVIANEAPGGQYSACGLSIYLPPADRFNPSYLELQPGLGKYLGAWPYFLGLYYQKLLGQNAPNHPLIRALQARMEKLIREGRYRPAAT
jgi:hypothetical protein